MSTMVLMRLLLPPSPHHQPAHYHRLLVIRLPWVLLSHLRSAHHRQYPFDHKLPLTLTHGPTCILTHMLSSPKHQLLLLAPLGPPNIGQHQVRGGHERTKVTPNVAAGGTNNNPLVVDDGTKKRASAKKDNRMKKRIKETNLSASVHKIIADNLQNGLTS